MGIKHYKASEHSPEAPSAIKAQDNLFITAIDRELKVDAGTPRILPCVWTLEKGKPYIYTAYGPTAVYFIEGEYEMEDQNDPEKPVLLFKGDVVLIDEGTIVKCSTPSKARAFGIAYMEAPKVLTDAVS